MISDVTLHNHAISCAARVYLISPCQLGVRKLIAERRGRNFSKSIQLELPYKKSQFFAIFRNFSQFLSQFFAIFWPASDINFPPLVFGLGDEFHMGKGFPQRFPPMECHSGGTLVNYDHVPPNFHVIFYSF